jgi:glutamyl-tRNA synthetase
VITLDEIPNLIAFLFVPESKFVIDAESAARVLTPESKPIIEASVAVLARLNSWEITDIEEALRLALLDGLGLKPKHAFGPVRVAITGARISPPLFESLHLLGRERSLSRLSALL